ncbi:hypothetical protein SDC9_124801 [bioreactor metagenome]|uniref:SsuA/THI5-like domain-containing protein n=1 Tax=bioreactor metagenome TaxID=1076179 RepID=A0A645CLI4_9ZZZZ
MDANPDEAAQMCSDFNEECGITLSVDTAKLYLAQDPYYDLQMVYDMMHDTSTGKDYSVMEEKLLGVLDFFVNSGKYKAGDDAKFMGHMDTKLIDDVYNASK